MSTNHYTFYLKPTSVAAKTELLKRLASVETTSEALVITVADEESVSGVYRVPELILTHLRSFAPTFEALVYYEHRYHGVRALGPFKELVRALVDRHVA